MNTVTYNVRLALKGQIDDALARIVKRGARRGIADFEWSWGKPFVMRHVAHRDDATVGADVKLVGKSVSHNLFDVEVIPLNLPEILPVINGWRFVAALEHAEGGTIVHAVPGEEVPKMYRDCRSSCDHCNADRKRNDTFVLRHTDGSTKQVGSTCIRDFLGNSAPHNIAIQATIVTCIVDTLRSLEDGFEGGRAREHFMLTGFLATVSAVMRENGWVSRKMANERDTMSTSDVALSELRKLKPEIVVNDADCDLARCAADWAENISDEAVDAESGDYLHNVRVIAIGGTVESRNAGVAASIVNAYQRAIGAARISDNRRTAANVHVGVVGKRETFKDAQLDFVAGYETQFGYTTVLSFILGNGATVVWKASNTNIGKADIGKVFTITGKVKNHGEYKGRAQTNLSHCKVESA